MKKLLIATHNPAKLAEFKTFLSNLPLELVSLSDIGISEDVEEDGETYEENSKKKALYYAQKSGLPAIADDGGIEIVELNNEPGVRSRRWLGHHATDEELINHMQKVSKELPEDKRDAYFRTVITFAMPTGSTWSEMGEIHGIIAKKPSVKKKKGYPYRSFFFLTELNKFYFEDELSSEEMNVWNHRKKGVEEIKKIIERELLLS